MSTPGSVELDEDILLVVDNNLLVVTTNDNGDRALLSLRNGLRLNAGIHFTVNDILNELANVLSVNLFGLIVRVLGILGSVLDSESREVLGLKVEVASVGAIEFSIKGNNVNGAAVLFSDGTEIGRELLPLLGGLSKDVSQGNAGLRKMDNQLGFSLKKKKTKLLSRCFNLPPCTLSKSRDRARRQEGC